MCAFAAATARAQVPAPKAGSYFPIDEYHSLRARGNPLVPLPLAPPVDATLTRVEYDLRVDPSTSLGAGGEAIAGRALLTVDVLREGWVKVPIPAGLMVRDARLDGQPVSLIEGPPRARGVVTTGPRRAVARISLPLASSAGTESIALPSSAAPLSRAVLTLPRGGVELTVTGGFISERSESATESRWTALGRAEPAARIFLEAEGRRSPRRAAAAFPGARDPGDRAGRGSVGDLRGGARGIQQGMARELSLAIPAGLVVNQVNGATVADWDVTAGLLRVRFLDPVTTEVSFVVQGEGRLPAARGHRRRWSACPPPSARAAAWRSTCSAPARSRSTRCADSSRPTCRISPTWSPAASRHRWSRFVCGRSAAPIRDR